MYFRIPSSRVATLGVETLDKVDGLEWTGGVSSTGAYPSADDTPLLSHVIF